MPILNIISELQAQIPQLEKAYEVASRSYHESDGCCMLEMHAEGASMELDNARWQLEKTMEAVSAALAAI